MGRVNLGGSTWYSGWDDRSKISALWNDRLKVKRWALHEERDREMLAVRCFIKTIP